MKADGQARMSIATTADHVWIARNREKFIPIARVDWTQPALFGRSGNDNSPVGSTRNRSNQLN